MGHIKGHTQGWVSHKFLINLTYQYWTKTTDLTQISKFIYSLDCKYSNCILTPNEDFISRGRIDLFDAVVIAIEAFKEDPVS